MRVYCCRRCYDTGKVSAARPCPECHGMPEFARPEPTRVPSPPPPPPPPNPEYRPTPKFCPHCGERV